MNLRAKQIMFLILILTVRSSMAFAATPKCALCESAEKNAKEIRGLNYLNDDDRFKGEQKALAAVKQLQDFAKLPKTSLDRTPLFKSLLELIREAGPYDTESQLASVLAETMKSDTTLKALYADYVRSLKKATKPAESCRTERLETSVDQATCLLTSGIAGQEAKQESKVKACVKPFNFESCLKTR